MVNPGDPVARVDDSSGKGNHLLLASGATRPTYQKDSGRFPYLQFDGVSNFLSAAFTFSQPVTRISGIRPDVFPSGGCNAWDGLSSYLALSIAPPDGFSMYAGAFGPVIHVFPGTAEVRVLTEIWNGASSTLQTNNATVNGPADPGSNFAIGGAFIGGAHPGITPTQMKWYGGVHIGRILTSTEIANMKSYLTPRMGIYI